MISIIIPVYNLWQMSKNCLQSLANNKVNCELEIILVDNASSDATIQEAESYGRELFGEHFRYLRHNENLGFAKACNAGAKIAKGEFLFFLNNDTCVKANWCQPLLQKLEQDNMAAVGPLLLYPNGRNQHCGVGFSLLNRVLHLYVDFPGKHHLLYKERQLQAISAAAILLDRAKFASVGGFYEGYQNGHEDLDLCFALRQKGYRLAIAPESVIIHHEGKSAGRHQHDLENAKLFSQRFGKMARPDLHIHAANDGYEAHLNEMANSYLCLPSAKEAEWNAKLKDLSQKYPEPTAIFNFLTESLQIEPLWQGGNKELVNLLLAKNEVELALNKAIENANLFPTVAMKRQLFALANKIGQKQFALEIAKQLAPDATRTKEAILIVKQHLQLAKEANDLALAKIFQDWLLEQGAS